MSDAAICSTSIKSDCAPPSDPNHCRTCVKRRPGNNNVIPFSYVVLELQTEQNYENMSDWLEYGPHIAPHTDVFAGTMELVPTSPSDPAFWVHHAYIDKLFAAWQEYHLVRNGLDTSTCDTCTEAVMPFYDEPL